MLKKQTYQRGKLSGPITVVQCTECKESVDSQFIRSGDWFPHKPSCSLYISPVSKSEQRNADQN